MSNLSPKRPYFIRALHEWLTDNDFTPYLLVDISHSELVAPTQYAQDGRLVLNASYTATKDLHIDDDAISFSARFGGVSEDLWLPMASVMGIFAKEDQSHALFFDPSEYDGYTPKDTKSPPKSETLKKDSPKKPKAGSPLRIIK